MRKGGTGAVLNSKSEFNRSYIPRLKVVDEEKVKELEESEKALEQITREKLEQNDNNWERRKKTRRAVDIRRKGEREKIVTMKRNIQQEEGGGKSKKLNYSILQNLGEEEEATKTTFDEAKTTPVGNREEVNDPESGEGAEQGVVSSKTPEEEPEVTGTNPLHLE